MNEEPMAKAAMNEELIIAAKRDCPTCTLIEPVYAALQADIIPTAFYSQDDPSFPTCVTTVHDDRTLGQSYRLNIEFVPTIVRLRNGEEVDRTYGWHREDWQRVSGIATLGAELPASQPGCGAHNVEPGMRERLMVRFGDVNLTSRALRLSADDDSLEACFERGWTDGLPVVPPTDERIVRMLSGTNREADDIIGLIPPNRVPCTVEKVAINAVMAGCRPAYMPVVLAVVAAALKPEFAMHGLLCTTYFSGPLACVAG